MAKFEIALPLVLQHEGGYVNDSADSGAETYAGVSRKNNPNWTGWKVIDAYKAEHGAIKHGTIIKDSALDTSIAAIYKCNYWNKIWGDNINDQGVANFLFDWHVNSGYHSVTALQTLLDVRNDGVMGVTTVRALNNYPYKDLLTKLIAARTAFVKGIVARTPTQGKFLDGWINRIQSFA